MGPANMAMACLGMELAGKCQNIIIIYSCFQRLVLLLNMKRFCSQPTSKFAKILNGKPHYVNAKEGTAKLGNWKRRGCTFVGVFHIDPSSGCKTFSCFAMTFNMIKICFVLFVKDKSLSEIINLLHVYFVQGCTLLMFSRSRTQVILEDILIHIPKFLTGLS